MRISYDKNNHTVDTRAFAGRGIAAYVTIDIEGSTVATASGAWDAESRLYLPKLTASLSDARSGLRMASSSSTLRGTVYFDGAVPVRPHVVRGTLVDSADHPRGKVRLLRAQRAGRVSRNNVSPNR